MIKNIIYIVLLFAALLYYFDKKGWIKITPQGKKKAIEAIQQGVKLGKEIKKDVEKEITEDN